METVTTKNLPTREERRKIGDKARAIYAPLRKQLEKEHWEEYITINYDNGDYAVAAEHMDAVRKMREKHPGKLCFTFRIGALYFIFAVWVRPTAYDRRICND